MCPPASTCGPKPVTLRATSRPFRHANQCNSTPFARTQSYERLLLLAPLPSIALTQPRNDIVRGVSDADFASHHFTKIIDSVSSRILVNAVCSLSCRCANVPMHHLYPL